MTEKKREHAVFLFMLLSALFIASLVVTNLIANKFVYFNLGFKEFRISAGVLPYPVTFLVTDIISEIYGRKKATQVVAAGFVASMFVLGVLWFGDQFRAIEESPVSDETYRNVFANAWRVILSSMLAYLVAQFADVRIYHFWKKLTNGKHLWLRNNGSTIVSQLLDTTFVVGVLFVGQLSLTEMGLLIRDGWIYKVIFALLDTPFMYAAIYFSRRYFGLKPNEEIRI